MSVDNTQSQISQANDTLPLVTARSLREPKRSTKPICKTPPPFSKLGSPAIITKRPQASPTTAIPTTRHLQASPTTALPHNLVRKRNVTSQTLQTCLTPVTTKTTQEEEHKYMEEEECALSPVLLVEENRRYSGSNFKLPFDDDFAIRGLKQNVKYCAEESFIRRLRKKSWMNTLDQFIKVAIFLLLFYTFFAVHFVIPFLELKLMPEYQKIVKGFNKAKNTFELCEHEGWLVQTKETVNSFNLETCDMMEKYASIVRYYKPSNYSRQKSLDCIDRVVVYKCVDPEVYNFADEKYNLTGINCAGTGNTSMYSLETHEHKVPQINLTEHANKTYKCVDPEVYNFADEKYNLTGINCAGTGNTSMYSLETHEHKVPQINLKEHANKIVPSSYFYSRCPICEVATRMMRYENGSQHSSSDLAPDNKCFHFIHQYKVGSPRSLGSCVHKMNVPCDLNGSPFLRNWGTSLAEQVLPRQIKMDVPVK
uniref:Uncharacterized protein n=1 Tax=Panagrolaimus sp. JU765 TaxID=591449 RepID=A0AC34R039_9BILA